MAGIFRLQLTTGDEGEPLSTREEIAARLEEAAVQLRAGQGSDGVKMHMYTGSKRSGFFIWHKAIPPEWQ